MSKSNFIITISGTPGSGKSTLAKMLADTIHGERIYVGNIRRELARAKGLTLSELNQYGLSHPETDVDIDKKVAQEAREHSLLHHVIVEGRTQFYFLPESIKIYIKVSIKEGAKRIWQEVQNQQAHQARNEGLYKSLAEVEQQIKERQESDRARYQKYYNLDHTDESHYDFVLDTTGITPQQGLDKILDFLKEKGLKY